VNPVALAIAAFITAAIGTLGGLGGAILLVPILVLSGMEAKYAAPLGLVSVAAGSLAAAPHQLKAQVVNQRLGVATEIAASSAALIGALVALVAAFAGARRKGIRNLPDPTLSIADVGEIPGTLAGVYPLGDEFVPYRANRLPLGLLGMGMAGLISGLSGVGGGWVKTPTASEIMHVPVKVAAATSTFTVGVTAAVGLLVYESQGRIVISDAALVAAAGLIGGTVGVRLQHVLPPPLVRRGLSAILAVIGVLLIVRR